jgi:PiT family inorganic phosphate transporter
LTATALLVAAACLYGLVSGFNDGGNLLASFTSGRVISPRLAALLLLAVPLGPLLLGTAVARTISVSVIDLPGQGPLGFVLISLVAVAVVLLSWQLRIPTSMTLALVGSMVGWVLAADAGGVRWAGLLRVVVAMPLSVLGGGALAFVLYRLSRQALGRLAHARVLALARLQVAAAAFQAFAYGANDLEKTLGLLAVAGGSAGVASGGASLSFHDVLPLAGSFVTFALGTLLGGWRLARRIGFGVFRVRPMEALTEQVAAAAVVAALAGAGAPVSTTQTISGGLVGVGAGARASAIRWEVVREMLASWLVTLPVSLLGALGLHLALRWLGAAR